MAWQRVNFQSFRAPNEWKGQPNIRTKGASGKSGDNSIPEDSELTEEGNAQGVRSDGFRYRGSKFGEVEPEKEMVL